MFTIKLDHGLSEAGYDRIVEWEKIILPKENRSRQNFYDVKSMMKPLNLWYYKIDMCPNFCMLYYLETTELTECRTCEHAHYKPRTSREMIFVARRKLIYFSVTYILYRLFMSPKTVEHITWHHSHDAVNRVMMHPFRW